jgi:site-specific DNA-methyltransferase (adenine-specific)
MRLPSRPVADVIDMLYSGDKLHPTQKAVAALCGRKYLGMELDPVYFEQAVRRLKRIPKQATP